MRNINVAVLGTGYWGRKIVDEYCNIPSVKLKAVADISDENLEFCRDRYGVENLYKDYREVIEDDSITAVNVCLPNNLHYKVCREALESGKHVLVEKPMTLTSEEGWELVNLAQEDNLTLSVGHIYRFNNAMLEIKRLIDQKFFGRVFLMNFEWKNLERPFQDRDVIVDLAPHYFDIMNFLLGDWPSRITCIGRPYRRGELEEAAYIISELKSGTLAHADINWLSPKKVRQIEIVGENRSVIIDAVAQEATVHESGYTYRLGIERNNTIRTELVHFLQSIGDPLTETRNSGIIGVKTVEMIEQAKRSLVEGKTATLPY
ncbi:MAG: Gfo/Idh/MocA family oxidoreductase [Methanomassiliicoccales archaeon]|nr:Gfo/Idh/MocA family oxidoreductase [Methanomassiliicoccales archaeon]NYT14462.1 Gfo/Idh/MocA family oxidoreductase [Methanomassiliicoccales archaeon]